jgi:RNA polymerase sigma factor (sigma-70 family)
MAELEQRLSQGDESSLEGILRLCGPPVAAALRRRYGILNWHDIEDILIVSVNRLWRYRNHCDPPKIAVRSLFFCIADSIARDLFKYGWQRAKRLEVPLEQGFLKPGPSSDLMPDDEVAGEVLESELLHDLRRVIEKLPEVYRHIVLADSFAHDRVASAEWLAEELDVSPSTVRVYRKRAMETIRTELARLGHEVPE